MIVDILIPVIAPEPVKTFGRQLSKKLSKCSGRFAETFKTAKSGAFKVFNSLGFIFSSFTVGDEQPADKMLSLKGGAFFENPPQIRTQKVTRHRKGT